MLDMIERMENAAERQFDEMIQDDGNFKCACGKIFSYDEAVTISPNPYAMPVCPACFDEYMEENNK